jgi:hypothetical protein
MGRSSGYRNRMPPVGAVRQRQAAAATMALHSERLLLEAAIERAQQLLQALTADQVAAEVRDRLEDPIPLRLEL